MKDFNFYAKNRKWILAGVETGVKVLHSWYFYAFVIFCISFIPVVNLFALILMVLWAPLYFINEVKALKHDTDPQGRWKSIRHWNSFNAFLMIAISITTAVMNVYVGIYDEWVEIWSIWQALALLSYAGIYVSVAIQIFEFRLKRG